MPKYWKGAQGGYHLQVGPAPADTDPYGYPGTNDTIVPGPGSTSAGSMPQGTTTASWAQDAQGSWVGTDPNAPSWAQGLAGSGLASPSAATSTSSGKPQMMYPGDLTLKKMEQDDLHFVAEQKRLVDQFNQQMALTREQMAADSANRQAALAESGADRASREAMHAQDLAQQKALAEMEKETRILAMSLDATLKTGYIPKALADKLGIQAGPTLETQALAWNRFTQAMQMAANPRDIVSFLYLQHGIQPDPSKPIPFMDALSKNLEAPQTNIGGNMDAISQQAREFTASNLAAMPNLIQNEAVNPAALSPIGGTGFLANLRRGDFGNTPQPTQGSNYLDTLRDFIRNRTPQFGFGG